MDAPFIVSKEIKGIRSSCTIKGKIISFRNEVDAFSLEEEKMVILDTCLKIKGVDMAIFPYSSSPYFNLYLPLIKDMRVIFPFPPFKVEVMWVINIAFSELASNNMGFVRESKIMHQALDISHIVGLNFIFTPLGIM